MATIHHPVRGSLAFKSSRKRARRIYPAVTTKVDLKDTKPLDFGGYKVGMAQVSMINDKTGSPTANQEIIVPVTIVEVPALKVIGIRAYQKTHYGIKSLTEVLASNIDKHVARKMNLPKASHDVSSLDSLQNVSEFSLIVSSQPTKAGIGKKTPEVFEVDLSGPVDKQLEYAKAKLGQEITINETFKTGQYMDVIGVTKGKGYQGSIFRFGVKLMPAKSQKLHRKVATLGPWHPAKIMPSVPQNGQMGFHKRTQYNTRLLKIGDKPEDVNKNGWNSYGLVKTHYIIVKGSVQGPTKRFIRFRDAIRSNGLQTKEPRIEEVIIRN